MGVKTELLSQEISSILTMARHKEEKMDTIHRTSTLKQ
jgi:hypothetical protein